MNAFDKFIVVNFWSLFLSSFSIIFLLCNLEFESVFGRLSLPLSYTLGFFALIVQLKYKKRLKLYNLILLKIKNKGYRKEVFEGKVNTVCALTMGVYIALKQKKHSDFKYLYSQFRCKTQLINHEDSKIEELINAAIIARERE